MIVPRKLSYCLSNLVNISPLIVPDFSFIRRGITDFKWRMKTPDSIIKFGWFVKIRSIHDDALPIMCVGFLITSSNQNWEVTPSILESSYVVMSLLYQKLVFALKSPRAIARKRLFTITKLRFNYWKMTQNHFDID